MSAALSADEARCQGLLPAPVGAKPCAQRERCLRYVDRHPQATFVGSAKFLCPEDTGFLQFVAAPRKDAP